MKHRILIYPNSNLRFIFQDLMSSLNCQYNFSFELLPKNNDLEQIVNSSSLDFNKEKKLLSNFKSNNGYIETDSIILITFSPLSDSFYSVNNLFISGRATGEEDQCTSIISLRNIEWNLFKEKYNYDIQKHSILHLIICVLISTYCKIRPHSKTLGCLLDQNNLLEGFIQKISKGYYLCSENGCNEKLTDNAYGHSILQLCHKLKNDTTSNTYVNIPLNDVRTEIINANIDSEIYFLDFILRIYNYAVKKPIEHWGFYNFLWNNNNPVTEKQAQIALNALFKIILELKSINIGKEVEASEGFIDFFLTYNFKERLYKVGIEVKNAQHRDINNGFNQLKRYLDSEETKNGILLVLWYKNDNYALPANFNSIESLNNHLDSLNTDQSYNIKTLIIDCTKKPSPSTVIN